MPVSTALLLASGAQGGNNINASASNQPQFVRGEKTTSSVKLRRRREDVGLKSGGGVGNLAGKKNRHSGDFSFFSNKRMEIHDASAVNNNGQVVAAAGIRSGGDFDYISFPANSGGVPVVHELRVAGATHHQPMSMLETSSAMNSRASQVQVIVRETAGGRCNNIKSAKAMSSSAINIADNGVNAVVNNNAPHFHQDVRRRNHNRSQSQQPAKHGAHRHTSAEDSSAAGGRDSANLRSLYCSSSYFPAQTNNNDDLKGLGGNAANHSPARTNKNVTKTCHNEFEFKRVNRSGDNLQLEDQADQGDRAFTDKMKNKEFLADSGSQESGIFSTGSSQESPRKNLTRQPGLGRRAITQVNLRDGKGRKNSYSNALARSQENLVKAVTDSQHGGEDDLWTTREDDLSTTDPGEVSTSECTTMKKGLLWQQRDKLFSRWKERYFILTKDFLQCFKKETSKITDMGGFIFKIKLSEIESIDLLDKKGYLTICINLLREAKVFLRKTEGIREWYTCIKDCIKNSKNRKSNRNSAIFLDRKQATDSSGMESWANQRRLKYGRSDSTPEVNKVGVKERITLDELSSLYKEEEEAEKKEEEIKVRKRINRLSLMTDVELPELTGMTGGGAGDLEQLDKSLLLRSCKSKGDSDSGHNSLNTNRSNTSTGSSKLSGPIESSFMEEEEDEDNHVGDDEEEEDGVADLHHHTHHHQPRQSPLDLSSTPHIHHHNNNGPRSLYQQPQHTQCLKEGPRSLYECSSVKESAGESVTISCSMPSPQIRISKPNNKNVIEVRYRERSRDGGAFGRGSPRSNAQQQHQSPHHHSQQQQQQQQQQPQHAHVNRLQITHV